jgi:hypothetical protein
VPPDAMEVEVVPANEMPRLSGTPSDLNSSGSQVPNGMNGADQALRPPQKPQKPQKPSERNPDTQASARPATKPPAQPQTGQAKTAQLGTTLAEAERADTAQPLSAEVKISDPQPDQPPPQTEETPDQTETAETLAQLALLGGQLGGGFQAPPINAARPGIDFTAAFRERVSSCSTLPPGIDQSDKISVALRVYFNRDGTLSSRPQVLEPIMSAKQQVLLENSLSALEKCQPYTMLPPDKYKHWKQLDLTFYPMNFFSN